MMNLLYKLNLRLFDGQTNVTTDSDLSAEMKQYYDMDLIENAKPYLVHNQFGQKKPIPKGKGKTIEFRKYDPLPKALTPLVEGVTPTGKKLKVSVQTATIKQYGDFVEISDILDLTSIDDNLVQANKLLGQQSGETIDTLTREIINGGGYTQYGENKHAARYLLIGGDATAANNDYFSCEMIRQAALSLRNNKARPVEGTMYVAIVHPDAVYNLKKDPEWQEANKYQNSKVLFTGEVGEYDGVKVVQTTEAKIFHAENLTAAARDLSVASVAGKIITVHEAITAGEATALEGRKIIVKGYLYTVASAAAGAAEAATITVSENIQGTPATPEAIYPGEAGAAGRDVYSALFIAADAYGTTEVEGGGLQTIIKQLGSGGTSDPLNQRATTGWKATHVAEILTDAYMVRAEHTSPYQRGSN